MAKPCLRNMQLKETVSVSSATLNYSYSGNLFAWWQTNFYLAGSYTRIPKSYNKKELFGLLVSWNNRMTWQEVGSLSMGFFYTSPTIKSLLFSFSAYFKTILCCKDTLFPTNNHYLNALFPTNIICFNAFFQANVSNPMTSTEKGCHFLESKLFFLDDFCLFVS